VAGAERIAILVLAQALLAAACGSSPSAPLIASLRFAPIDEPIRAGDTLTLTVDFVDDDGDLPGGAAEISLRKVPDQAEGDLFKVPLAGGGGSASMGAVTATVELPATTAVGHYQISITVLDRATRRSNPLVAEFDVTS
jgi:hypothetical protein